MSGTSGSAAAITPDQVVFTGVMRYVGDMPLHNIKAAWPGLQKARLQVLAGTAIVNGSAGQVIVQPGVVLEWSVTDSDDSSLNDLSIDPQAGCDAYLSFTYKGTAAG